jgi:hypothetical protein
LVWEPLVRTKDGKKSLPDDVIKAGQDSNEKDMYFSRLNVKDWDEEDRIGVINETDLEVSLFFQGYSDEKPFYYREKHRCLDPEQDRKTNCRFKTFAITTVLTNPNKCPIGWLQSDLNQHIPDEVPTGVSIPKLSSSLYLARFSIGNETIPGVVSKYYADSFSDLKESVRYKSLAFSKTQSNLKNKQELFILFVHCNKDDKSVAPSPRNGVSINPSILTHEQPPVSTIDVCEGRCTLVWKEIDVPPAGDIGLPDDIVVGGMEEKDGQLYPYYYVKAPSKLKFFVHSTLGYVTEKNLREMIFLKPSYLTAIQVNVDSKMELLTNPRKCTLKWMNTRQTDREIFFDMIKKKPKLDHKYPKVWDVEEKTTFGHLFTRFYSRKSLDKNIGKKIANQVPGFALTIRKRPPDNDGYADYKFIPMRDISHLKDRTELKEDSDSAVQVLYAEECAYVKQESVDPLKDIEKNNLGEHDCCPLVWKPITVTPYGRFLPKTAIKAGDNAYGDDIYYTKIRMKDGYDWVGFLKSSSANIGIFEKEDLKDPANPRRKYFFSSHTKCLDEYVENMKESDPEFCENVLEEPMAILTNPYNCVIGYWRRNFYGETPTNSHRFLFPMTGGMRFARLQRIHQLKKIWYDTVRTETNNHWIFALKWLLFSPEKAKKIKVVREHSILNPGLLGPNNKLILFEPFIEEIIAGINDEKNFVDERALRQIATFGIGTEVLYIDCVESFMKNMKVQISHVNIEKSNNLMETKEKISLRSTSVINTSKKPVTPHIKLSTTIRNSVKFKEIDSTIKNGVERLHVEPFDLFKNLDPLSTDFLERNMKDLGRFGILLQVKGETTDQKTREKKEFKKNEWTNQDSSLQEYKFQQMIVVPPKSNTTVSIMTYPIKKTAKYTAVYRFRVLEHQGKPMLTSDGIKNALVRLGIEDKDITQDGEELIWMKEGSVFIDGAMNAHVKVTSVEFQPQWKPGCKEEPIKTLFEYNTFPFGKTETM